MTTIQQNHRFSASNSLTVIGRLIEESLKRNSNKILIYHSEEGGVVIYDNGTCKPINDLQKCIEGLAHNLDTSLDYDFQTAIITAVFFCESVVFISCPNDENIAFEVELKKVPDEMYFDVTPMTNSEFGHYVKVPKFSGNDFGTFVQLKGIQYSPYELNLVIEWIKMMNANAPDLVIKIK